MNRSERFCPTLVQTGNPGNLFCLDEVQEDKFPKVGVGFSSNKM